MLRSVLCWTILLLLCVGAGHGARSYGDDGQSRDLDYIMSVLDVEALIEAAQEVLDLSFTELAEELAAEFSDGPEVTGANCAACRTAVSTLKTLIRNGAQFEDVRDQAISICLPIANGGGYIGDIICPGIIDNFGPEVMYVLNVTDADYSAVDICQLYRACDNSNTAAQKTEPRTWKAPRNLKSKEERNYDELLKVVHVTDIHVDQDYFEGAASYCDLPLCCRNGYNGTGSAEYWGDYQCGVPPHTVEAFLRQLAEYHPDIIIYTGDSPPHAIWLETQWGQIGDSKYVAEVLGDIFPDIPSYTALGNHDTFPVNMYGRNRPELLTEELNEALTSYWEGISRFGPEQIETFRYGGYYSSVIQPGLRVISYNSNYGTTENFSWLIPYDSGEVQQMFSFMESEFAAARENNEKVILLGHHPTGSRGYFRVYEELMYDITNTYGDIIVLHFLGHSHIDKFQMTIDEESGEARNVWLSTGAMGTYTNINPTAKLFYVDPTTFEPIDFDTYFLNFSAVVDNPSVEPQLEFMYRASDEYGLVDLSPDAWADFVDRMETDAELFWKYRYNEETRTSVPGPCDDACRRRALCSIKSVVADHRDACNNSLL